MKFSLFILASLLYVSSCQQIDNNSLSPVNWQQRFVHNPLNDSLVAGQTYLSVYSQIYSQTEHRTHDLTVTVSMRNTSLTDTIFIQKARYFDTHGSEIRSYFTHTVFITPMETVEIVINETDKEGGTGANFLFDWLITPNANEPLFEAVMISTSGQQGLSFTTQGIRVQ